MKQGLLLINLGTPASPSIKNVRQYLKQFLSDPYVIDLPKPIRLALLYCFILPFRPPKTAQAYKSIWKKKGSPLLIHTLRLKDKLQKLLSNDFKVTIGMRYGKPSIDDALSQLMDCQSITVLPLFPQYSSAATGSIIAEVYDNLRLFKFQPNIKVIRDFYAHPGFIEPMATLIKPHITTHDHILFSYHGLPVRQIIKSGCRKVCVDSCSLPKANMPCYRSQCYATSAALAHSLSLNPSQFTTAFQSRLGRTPWIQPYTDELLPKLVNKGIKNLLVACPSFTSDCLETLEEIGIRGKEQWLRLGGKSLKLVPSLNESHAWLKGIQKIIDQ